LPTDRIRILAIYDVQYRASQSEMMSNVESSKRNKLFHIGRTLATVYHFSPRLLQELNINV